MIAAQVLSVGVLKAYGLFSSSFSLLNSSRHMLLVFSNGSCHHPVRNPTWWLSGNKQTRRELSIHHEKSCSTSLSEPSGFEEGNLHKHDRRARFCNGCLSHSLYVRVSICVTAQEYHHHSSFMIALAIWSMEGLEVNRCAALQAEKMTGSDQTTYLGREICNYKPPWILWKL